MKYRCTHCHEVFEGKLRVCPNCGKKLKYKDDLEEKVEPAPVEEQPVEQPVEQPQPVQEPAPEQKVEEQAVAPAPVEEPKQEVVPVENQPVAPVPVEEGERVLALNSVSKFDGKLIQLIGWLLLGGFLCLITLDLMLPWMICKIVAWDCKHTVINGRRLRFTGKASQMFWKNILYNFLTIITLTIFGWFVPMKWKKWIVSHIHFEA